jgi:hypothetical protein
MAGQGHEGAGADDQAGTLRSAEVARRGDDGHAVPVDAEQRCDALAHRIQPSSAQSRTGTEQADLG